MATREPFERGPEVLANLMIPSCFALKWPGDKALFASDNGEKHRVLSILFRLES